MSNFMKLLLVLYSLSMSPDLQSQTIDPKIQEVYGAKAQELVSQNPDWLRVMTDLVQNRVKVIQQAEDPSNEKYPKLSEVALLNKYNKGLQRDVVFDPLNFNPLKYDFVVSAKNRQVYRVDHTDYLIVIEPQSFQ